MGPEMMGPLFAGPAPLSCVDSGVGGGEVPSLLRSLRVMWGRDCKSRDASRVPSQLRQINQCEEQS